MSKRKDKRTIVHIIDATGPEYRAILDSRSAKVLCGVALYRRERTADRKGHVTRRLSTFDNSRPIRERIPPRDPFQRSCATCKLLQSMQPADRDKWREERKLKADDAKAERADERTIELAKLDAEIARSQVDALVCLDAWESGDIGRVTRCNRWIPTSTYKDVYCNLQRSHAYGEIDPTHCRGPLPGEPPHVDLAEVLAMAVKAFKRSRGVFDRGVRLYVARSPFYCNDCGWKGYEPQTLKSIDTEAVSVSGKSARYCPQCYEQRHRRIVRQRPPNGKADLVCRFCDEVLDIDRRLGVDSSNEGHIRNHCVPCALRFLGKVESTKHLHQDEAPFELPGHLPSESFVLEHDEENEAQS